ncbi:50S ribosomal protein L11 methyltransferase [Gallionella capsiferriformans]|jgi:ribosomal protein L11 methyltransferase|uniref:Ribosomal protein L11 methyltransferase n=1 Tax=Gallionella capsiferriformans (strain ES-2) TaxID=395494 RepID=D9SE53_GALCS|nr:50S ribosomal protein L11 methyltransferase [Gallionella capsiferriformans]ADL56875.1 ribosomal protein L11 methyltransferase [Gallionella capsiferriformans ES-2]
MAWLTLIVDTDAKYAEALSDALLEHGALSVDLLDADADTPDEQAIFGEPGEPPPGVWQHNRVSALFDADADVAGILSTAAQIVGLTGLPEHRIETLADNDWVRLTQSQFEPIPISNRLWIVPTWHTAADPDAINIVLDPGLAFGTGSHPTTRLCLRWLDSHLQGGERVLDYGCGSGILAIAAIKLGAAHAVGVDVDAQAVTASRDNATANDVHEVAFYLPNQAPGGQYDLVVANILTNPLRLLAPLLAGATRTGGQIVLSGILEAQAQDVMAIYQQWFDLNTPVFEDGWSCLSGRKR